jgi:hypothetical protein
MTKLVVVLAGVVVVILVIVIFAARSMRAEDPEEFDDRPGSRDMSRGGHDDRYERYPARDARNGRPSQRELSGAGRAGGTSAGGGFDQRPNQQRLRGYDPRAGDGRGYDADRDVRPPSNGRNGDGRSDGRGSDGRRGDNRTQRRPEESQAPARARARRSGDSSEWDSSEWEKLSDVDYWAELAADKPLTTTAQPAAQPAAPARPGPERNTEVLPRRGAAAGAALRQDPVTGLPVRGRPQPADAGLTSAAARRADFTPAPPARADFTPASQARADFTPASQARADFTPAPASGTREPSRNTAVAPAEPRLSRHAAPAALPGPDHAMPQRRPRVDPDDDPLTSPSFPRIPASDSRSYRSGRADTPPRGSSTPLPSYQAPTQQFSAYESPTRDYPHMNGRETQTIHSNGYLPDPLVSRDAYPAPAGPPPGQLAPAAPPAAGNPYGSYVTPEVPAGTGYGEYTGMPSGAHSGTAGNGHGSYSPSALPSEAGQPASNGYWHHQGPGSLPGQAASGYRDVPGQFADPLGADQAAHYSNGYRNGYGAADPSPYPPDGYQAAPQDTAGYAPLDPYTHDGYGGYPGYGPAGR